MGDRTSARFTLGGHIETVAECEALVNAIAAEGVNDQTRDERVRDTDDAMTALRLAVETNANPSFYDNEVNYGTFDEIEAVVSKIPGIAASFQWDAGGSYPAGMKTVMPDGDEYDAIGGDGEPGIPLDELIKARESDDVLAALDEIIKDAKIASGVDMPAFTVSPAVAAWLKIFADKAA